MLGEMIELPGVPVECSAIECADPKVRFRSGQGRYGEVIQGRMVARQAFAIPHHHAVLFGAEQHASTRELKQRCKISFGALFWPNLLESPSIEHQQAFAGCCDPELRLTGV